MTITVTESADMSKYWRLITAGAQDDDQRVTGTWWVADPDRGGELHVQPVDVTVWHKKAQFGRVLHSGAFTAFVRSGEVDLSARSIRGDVADDCKDAWDVLLAAIKAATEVEWRPLEDA